jgi:hypothetical protein
MEWIYFRWLFLWFLFHDAFGVSDHIVLMEEWLFERWMGKNLRRSGRGVKDNSIPTFAVENWGKARNRFYFALPIEVIIIIIIIIITQLLLQQNAHFYY